MRTNADAHGRGHETTRRPHLARGLAAVATAAFIAVTSAPIPANAQTFLDALDVSSATTVVLSGTALRNEQVGTDDLFGGVTPLDLGANFCPPATILGGFHRESDGSFLMVFDRVTNVGCDLASCVAPTCEQVVRPLDVVRYDPGAPANDRYSVVLDAAPLIESTSGAEARIDAVSRTDMSELLLSFDIDSVTLVGSNDVARGEDVVRFDGAELSLFQVFDQSVGVNANPGADLNLNALHLVRNNGNMLVSFSEAVTATPGPGGSTLAAKANDVLEFDPDTGNWFFAYIGEDQHTGWANATLDALNGVIVCGNGMVDTGEQCDGDNLDNQTCPSLGFVSGTLSCTDNCTWDTTSCVTCGTGNVDGRCIAGSGGPLCQNDAACDSTAGSNDGDCEILEQCDLGQGTNDDEAPCTEACLNATCGDNLTCSAAGCTTGPNDSVEECDDGAANSDSVPNACRTDCGDPVCGDGVTDPAFGEQCDELPADPDDCCATDCDFETDGTLCVTDDQMAGTCDDAGMCEETIDCMPMCDCTVPGCSTGMPGDCNLNGMIDAGDPICTALCVIDPASNPTRCADTGCADCNCMAGVEAADMTCSVLRLIMCFTCPAQPQMLVSGDPGAAPAALRAGRVRTRRDSRQAGLALRGAGAAAVASVFTRIDGDVASIRLSRRLRRLGFTVYSETHADGSTAVLIAPPVDGSEGIPAMGTGRIARLMLGADSRNVSVQGTQLGSVRGFPIPARSD